MFVRSLQQSVAQSIQSAGQSWLMRHAGCAVRLKPQGTALHSLGPVTGLSFYEHRVEAGGDLLDTPV
jgi:hypothetical protein